MAGDEYASVGGGGLKLKGVKGGKVDKHRKKKSKKSKELADETATPPPDNQTTSKDDLGTVEGGAGASEDREKDDEADLLASRSTKTPTELRHEERRRKMLDERLKREGVKTHKERVEELNKYLSGLSEHHDMPKIGPG